jgi:hypothetical protein
MRILEVIFGAAAAVAVAFREDFVGQPRPAPGARRRARGVAPVSADPTAGRLQLAQAQSGSGTGGANRAVPASATAAPQRPAKAAARRRAIRAARAAARRRHENPTRKGLRAGSREAQKPPGSQSRAAFELLRG